MLILFDWFYTVNKEAVNGFHTKKVQVGILKGMILFIVSEIMFFFSIFWSFFTFKINPSLYIECIFPPKGIDIIKMNCFPLLNTVFLVYSGLFLMNSIYYLKKGRFNWSFLNLVITIILGLFFVLVQFKEYSDSVFSFNDSCYGSVFFLLTGFHGFHVIVGLIFLLICCYRLYLTNKFNYYKINKNLFWRKIIKTIYIVQILNFRINESRDTFSINYWINRNKNEYSSININTLSKYSFNNLMYIIIFCSIINFDHYKNIIKLSNLKKKKFFYKNIEFKKIDNKKLLFNIIDFKYISSNVNIYNDLMHYCNTEKKEIIFYLLFTNKIKKLFLLDFIFSLKLSKNNDFLYFNKVFYDSYIIFLKSLNYSYNLNYISSKSKEFYSWKSILLWINYNNLNVTSKGIKNFFTRRMDFKFILPFIGFKRDSNLGYICASWYWHFVDAIWIFVISVIYSDFLIILCEMKYLIIYDHNNGGFLYW